MTHQSLSGQVASEFILESERESFIEQVREVIENADQKGLDANKQVSASFYSMEAFMFTFCSPTVGSSYAFFSMLEKKHQCFLSIFTHPSRWLVIRSSRSQLYLCPCQVKPSDTEK